MSGDVRPGGRECELFNDHIFCELRALAQVPDDFVNSGWNLEELTHGGGKGGTLMARIGDSYIVKELSKSDHASLLQLTASYGQHVRSGDTLLCPMYLHFRDTPSGRSFFAMRNSSGSGPFSALYDLKGCADDKLLEEDGEPIRVVRKRIWNVGMWVSHRNWSKERVLYHEGKRKARTCEIVLPAEQRAWCLKSMARDTEWLAQQRIMDYSLLVAVTAGSSADVSSVCSSGSSASPAVQKPIVYKDEEGQDVAVYLSIIDILQRWTMGKCAARVLKCSEWDQPTIPPAMYARRFHQHFTDHLVELPWHIGGASAPAADAQGPGGAPTGDELVKVDLAPSEATTSAPAVAEQDFSKDLSHNDSAPWQVTSASVDVDQERDLVRDCEPRDQLELEEADIISAGSVESGPSGRTGRDVGGRRGGRGRGKNGSN
mmetsp:Transcript_12557/g.44483  ORF Transcript_12557/g.44483 Transcript_12557/m.44483 type:complete len:430 (+) Transcript_12557:119-1408(+)